MNGMPRAAWRGMSTSLLVLCSLGLGPPPAATAGVNRLTVLYDAFGKPSDLSPDWGYSVLVEHAGRRILFDTGNDGERFAHNVAAARADLSRLDFAVVSHRHLDHTGGLGHLHEVNPGVTIYVPQELGGPFGSALPDGFYRRDGSLPAHMRYFGDQPARAVPLGTAWPGARFEAVAASRELVPGVHLVAVTSETPGTLEMRELALAIETPAGLVLIVGCSHPGIERMIEAARRIEPRIHLVVGGFHLPSAPDAEVARIATELHDTLDVEQLAPGHCTGEPAFAAFRQKWGERYVYAGLGTVIDLP